MDNLCFYSLGSGSSGNSYFFGNSHNGILIDAGVGPRSARRALRGIGIEFSDIYGIFVSHDHFDHIKSVGALGGKYNIPVYATEIVHNRISKFFGDDCLAGNRKYIEKGGTVSVGDFKIKSFGVSHDGTDNVGYFIEYGQHRILVATDLGIVNDELLSFLHQSDVVVLESNYDLNMLETGRYPEYLKQRIKSETGHLCNDITANVLAENWNENFKYIFLCHLSADNNQPGIVLNTIEKALYKKNINFENVTIAPLKRRLDEPVFIDGSMDLKLEGF